VSSSPSGLRPRLARTVREERLFEPGDTLIVALSGGADSTALLDLLNGLPGFPLRLVAAHLNHCLRGRESDADEEFCRCLALRYAIPFESRRVDIKAFAAQQGLNLEDAGRRARITYFDELRQKWRATAVALAHHADDQAETVLMRLLRGAGPSGLAGMPYLNWRGFIRPLLDVTRPEIEAYLAEQGLTFRQDASNLDTTFLRNRIRHELLPLLEQYNPAIRECLATTARLLLDEDRLLGQLAGDVTARACSMEGNTIVCDIALLTGQLPAMRRRVLRQAVEQLTGSLDHFSSRHITALEQLMDSARPNAALNLPQGVTAVREYGSLLMRRTTAKEVAGLNELIIREPGRYPLPDGGFITVNQETSLPDFSSISPDTACFDLEKSPFPWLVRTFRNGDRITPLGMRGSKKVKEIFIEARIPLDRRRRTPLIFSGDTLIWVCGLRTSQLARVDAGSPRIVTAVYSGI